MKPTTQQLRQVDALFTPWDRPDTPGCLLGLIRDGQLFYTRGYGMANLEYNLPITPDTVFYLASNSKQFTAASILLLVQQGLLSLDDELRTYLPEMPAYTRPVRIEHLIHHTSGLREHGLLSGLAGLCPLDYTTAAAVALICRQQGVNYQAGEAYLYNNAGYVLQAEIVQRVSGQPLPLFVKQHIFDPLYMRHTHFEDDCTRLVPNRAASYEAVAGQGYRSLLMTNNVTGSAGVMTTLHDLSRWDQNFYAPTVGGADFIRQMETLGRLNSGESIPYSAGLMHAEVGGLSAIYHTGTEFGFRSLVMRFPHQHFTIICLANLAGFQPGPIAEAIAQIFFGQPRPAGSQLGPSAIWPVPNLMAEAWAGLYFDPASGAFIELSLQAGQFFAQVSGSAVPLHITTHNAGSPENETLTLETRGRYLYMPVKITLTRTGQDCALQPALAGCRLPVLNKTQPVEPDPDTLAACAGLFYSPELQVVYEFRVSGGKLVTAHSNGLQGTLSPGPTDCFILDGFSVCFIRAENAHVSGFRLWEVHARGLVFIRMEQAR